VADLDLHLGPGRERFRPGKCGAGRRRRNCTASFLLWRRRSFQGQELDKGTAKAASVQQRAAEEKKERRWRKKAAEKKAADERKTVLENFAGCNGWTLTVKVKVKVKVKAGVAFDEIRHGSYYTQFNS
jgi:hypothetical protein